MDSCVPDRRLDFSAQRIEETHTERGNGKHLDTHRIAGFGAKLTTESAIKAMDSAVAAIK